VTKSHGRPRSRIHGLISFTSTEEELVQTVLKAEEFRFTAWEKYGPEWTNYVPEAINAFIWYYFGGFRLYPWQLAIYYAPQKELTIMGGRGSGKTQGVALAMAAYHALHPGEPWLHVSPVKDQAQRTYEAIMDWGQRATGRHTFVQRFVYDAVVAPFPEIRLRPWHEADPGNIFRFRPLGSDTVENLRSLETGTLTVDEAFRVVESGATYALLRGCIRGINQVRLALIDPTARQRIEDLIYRISITTGSERQALEQELEALIAEYGLARRGMMVLSGNASPHKWCWQRYDMVTSHPADYWSLTVTTYDNPAFGKDNITALEQAHSDNPELMAVEMLARRPLNLGTIFVASTIHRCLDPKLLSQAVQGTATGIPGYLLRKHLAHDIFLYAVPAVANHHYVVGADPGSGILPDRNKWVILAYDITIRPCELVYFEMGNLHPRQAGDFIPFWERLRYVVNTYPTAVGDVWVESTGSQKGMEQLAFPEDLRVVPISFTSQKPVLINQHRTLMSKGLLRWPPIPQLEIEHSNYDLPDHKLVQDVVMAAICASGAIWRYVDIDYESKPTELWRYVDIDYESKPTELTTSTILLPDRQQRPLVRI
jgi:hypothetical protein